jgi:hypothetical protein
MKKFMILILVGLFLAMGAAQAAAKHHHKKPDLAGTYVGSATFIDTAGAITTLADGDVELDLSVSPDNKFLVYGNFIVNFNGTQVTIPVSGRTFKDYQTVNLVGQGMLIHMTLNHRVTEAVGTAKVIAATDLPVGFATFKLSRQ